MKYDRKLITITRMPDGSSSYKPPVYEGHRVTGYTESMQKKLDYGDTFKLPKHILTKEAKAARRLREKQQKAS
jgi:hypothetical protein